MHFFVVKRQLDCGYKHPGKFRVTKLWNPGKWSLCPEKILEIALYYPGITPTGPGWQPCLPELYRISYLTVWLYLENEYLPEFFLFWLLISWKILNPRQYLPKLGSKGIWNWMGRIDLKILHVNITNALNIANWLFLRMPIDYDILFLDFLKPLPLKKNNVIYEWHTFKFRLFTLFKNQGPK